jgi:asparagine synthase (glutamine-hydrolysing)
VSVQFGRWNLDGKPIDDGHLESVGATLAQYGPDGASSYANTSIAILYYAFHTTKESRLETQPYISTSGAVITWDGRLDNRADLISALNDSSTINSTDLDIVAAGYEKWRTGCFSRLVGDWALSIWNPNNQSLILATDTVGTRHLFYSCTKDEMTWSTILDPLILLAGRTLHLNEEYVAGYLSHFPAAHLTPYVGIFSVPPACFVLLQPGRQAVSKHWDFDPTKRIRYRTDAEYEEHFRDVFARAVQCRLRSDHAVLAELSGGRDSSSIVCMADAILANGLAETPRLDTLSYYDDSEPNWNERPYFTKVEEKRGRTGWHINVALHQEPGPHSNSDFPSQSSFAAPGLDGRSLPEDRMCLMSQQNRVVLSGIGGDEVMGGAPTPIPELQDLLTQGQLGILVQQLKLWALQGRKPWLHLFFEAVRGFFPPYLVGVPKNMQPASWLQSEFVKRHRIALTGYRSRTRALGPLPSFQESIGAVESLRRQLARTPLPFDPPFERRYPFLDRGLLEFMFAIPREQLVRPSRRRSLMRRALVGFVPDEILNRKGKAFVVRRSMTAISRDWADLGGTTQNLLSDSLGIVAAERFLEILEKGRRGEEIPIVPMIRTLFLERWLRNLNALGIVNLDKDRKSPCWPLCRVTG